ncbi:MAG: putative glycosyltransferase EpsD [Candidatus Anoxychlamydiales bacterium]|nr:putative glycosyltransferase EpsD [Candidatus Anoxychlamydiales bacterium]
MNFEKIKVDPKDSKKFKKDFGINEKDFLVGTACFMRSWKGIADFLKAAKILENKNENNIKFIIIGGGHKDSYIKMAKDLNLKNMIFTDHLENPYPAINALDVFALLSTAHEGVSQASMQALFLQKPIIATKTGGLKEVCIDKKTGIQVPIFSSHDVAKAVLKLQKDEKLRNECAVNAKKLAVKFSEDNMIDEMKKVYEKLI